MKVVVLAGGTSTERDVSLNSGSMIYKALVKKGHKAVLLDVYLGYEGAVDKIFESEKDWAEQIGSISEENPDIEQIKALRKGDKKVFFGPNVLKICEMADVVFLALHGANGEDGKIQACFELMGIPYTGTDYVSSAIAMDKGISKDLFLAHGIQTPAGIRLKKGEKEPVQIPLPCIVKASGGGSSVGVYIVNKEEEYEEAKKAAFSYGEEIIIEQYIKGREFSVGVMNQKALPVIEIAPKQGFYDYKNKYQEGSSIETCPADLSQEKTRELQQTAERVFQALRMKNYARMDFMMNEQGEIFCLEANSLPGMTRTSLLPQEAAAIGISFEDLCEQIMEYGAANFKMDR
ncbi:D-alanine--D-alanine ligase [Lachnospiraceae bacterium OttesenSCG-928-D06]|nr:D-alanine--D-alanine ligase [Lachnospiraceae bacterium OttesenSCG-928-D06]